MSAARSEGSEKVQSEAQPAAIQIDYPFYGMRIWNGMVASSWWRMLVRNRFAISPTRGAELFTLLSVINSILGAIQRLIFGRRIANSVLESPPLFIIGHWRTGTTYLHELITLDERFTAPTTLECYAPAHFLISDRLIRFFSFLVPSKRPMDNVSVSLDSPQEDEFALMNLGLPTPYETIIFPNHRPLRHEFLNMTEVAPEQVEGWKSGLLAFLQSVNYRRKREQKPGEEPRRIVLKSPPHTARLKVLRQMFPTAKFIHVVRHPCDIFASTDRLWRVMYETQAQQTPRFGSLANGSPAIEQYIFDTMDLLYRDFFAQSAEIPAGHFCEVRYEDLVHAPVVEMERIYRELNLGAFETVRPRIEAQLHARKDYKSNEHPISQTQEAEILRRWRWYAQRYGYENPARAG